MPTLIGKHITISDGLQGQDDHFETLMSLWEELQLCSLDSAVHPECDLLSFSQSAFLLGVITLNKDPDPFKVAPLNLDSSVWTPVTPYDYKLDSVDDAILEELVGVKNPPANPAWNLVPSPRGGNLNTSQSAQPAESIWTPYQYQRDSDEDAMLEDLVRGNSSSSFRPLTNANPVWDPVPSEPRGGSFMKNLMVQKANAEKTRSAGFFVPGPSNPKLDVAYADPGYTQAKLALHILTSSPNLVY
ncbi:hypothetical protein FB451DRAFT_1390784 [Mycena latifolia]|nr:hypothetical protein FB451DRAFT_1390784 [Mycena latifolia]